MSTTRALNTDGVLFTQPSFSEIMRERDAALLRIKELEESLSKYVSRDSGLVANIRRLESAILAEREACARLCEDRSQKLFGGKDYADAIREREVK